MICTMAFDGGATHTLAGLYDPEGTLLAEIQGEGCNPIEQGAEDAAAVLIRMARRLLEGRTDPCDPCDLCAGISGAADAAIQSALAQALCRALPLRRAIVSTDLHPILWANLNGAPGLLVIAGTGSSVLGQDAMGRMLKAGGRGALIGDSGGAYAVAVSALRAAALAVDRAGPETTLTEQLVIAAGVAGFEALPAWAAAAGKAQVAALAPAVSAAARAGDAIARQCLEGQADQLAAIAAAVYRRLEIPRNGRILLHGGLFAAEALYRARFTDAMRAAGLPEPAMVTWIGPRAVAVLARHDLPGLGAVIVNGGAVYPELPPTEQNPGPDMSLDALSPIEIVRVMNRADRRTVEAIADQAEPLAAALAAAAQALQSGGRILYVGAGTSGRLGVLDASECPPTFGVEADRVLGIIAGGDRALRHSVEAAEDDETQGAADIAAAGVRPHDFVVGIAASGATPYVAGALRGARRAGAQTALLCCNPMAALPVDIRIALDTGPEVLAGSTRLKAGTATKMALNILSTGAMARAGKVCQGLMIGMKPTNAKLRRRAARIIAQLTGTDETRGAALLREADGNIAVAVLMHQRGLDYQDAQAVLRNTGGLLRNALQSEVCTKDPDGAQ